MGSVGRGIKRMQRDLKFGISYDFLSADGDAAGDFERSLEVARLAEDLGFDSIWAGEAHWRTPGMGHAPSPLTLCFAWGAATKSIRVGTAVLLLPAYTPLQVAEKGALIDQITRGRLVLGLGAGQEVFKHFGPGNLLIAKASHGKIME